MEHHRYRVSQRKSPVPAGQAPSGALPVNLAGQHAAWPTGHSPSRRHPQQPGHPGQSRRFALFSAAISSYRSAVVASTRRRLPLPPSKLVILAQLLDLAAQPFQPRPAHPDSVHQSAHHPARSRSGAHPLPKKLLTTPEFPGHLRNRTTSLYHQPGRLDPILRSEPPPASLLLCHDTPSFRGTLVPLTQVSTKTG